MLLVKIAPNKAFQPISLKTYLKEYTWKSTFTEFGYAMYVLAFVCTSSFKLQLTSWNLLTYLNFTP